MAEKSPVEKISGEDEKTENNKGCQHRDDFGTVTEKRVKISDSKEELMQMQKSFSAYVT